ncbi:MAG: SH3 domain-containing protein [Caldilineaceae bacterium]
MCFILVACGPESKKVDQNQLTLTTQQIAQDFAATGDLGRAKSALAGLEVANPSQWLLMVAEETAKDQAAQPQLVAALVKLTEALDLHSPILADYATAHNLSVTTASGLSAKSDNAATGQTIAIANVSQPPPAAAPTATSEPTPAPVATATAEPTATADQSAQVLASSLVNLRSGPGTTYDLAGGMQVGESAKIIAKSPDAGWWKVQLSSGSQAWVFAQLVQSSGALDSIAVASDIPPSPTAQPVAIAQPTAAPEVSQPAPTATAAPQQQNSSAPYFKLIARRMWSKAENGDCRGQHLLRINVVDANGARLNGVTLTGLYTGAVLHTGEQGKGDGVMEFDLYGSGEGFIVTADTNGAFAGSDRAEGFTTNSRDIDVPTLIAGGYCEDATTCQVFYDSWGCKGHHSWEATFQRNY